MHLKENELRSTGFQCILPDQDFKERPRVTTQAVVLGDEGVIICQQISWIWSTLMQTESHGMDASVNSTSSATANTSAPPSSLVFCQIKQGDSNGDNCLQKKGIPFLWPHCGDSGLVAGPLWPHFFPQKACSSSSFLPQSPWARAWGTLLLSAVSPVLQWRDEQSKQGLLQHGTLERCQPHQNHAQPKAGCGVTVSASALSLLCHSQHCQSLAKMSGNPGFWSSGFWS